MRTELFHKLSVEWFSHPIGNVENRGKVSKHGMSNQSVSLTPASHFWQIPEQHISYTKTYSSHRPSDSLFSIMRIFYVAQSKLLTALSYTV